MRGRIVVAADAHLRAAVESAPFWDFLRRARAARAVYLLGDIFDLWLGDDDDSDFALEATRRFAACARETPLYFARGNHDFLLGAAFARKSGARALADDFSLAVGGRRIFLTHGDLLLADDARYRRWRPIMRSSILRAGFLRLPLAARRRIAQKIASGGRGARVSRVCEDAAASALSRRDCEVLIMGHTHAPGVFEWRRGGRDCARFMLPAWDETEGGYAEIDAEGRVELRAAR